MKHISTYIRESLDKYETQQLTESMAKEIKQLLENNPDKLSEEQLTIPFITNKDNILLISNKDLSLTSKYYKVSISWVYAKEKIVDITVESMAYIDDEFITPMDLNISNMLETKLKLLLL